MEKGGPFVPYPTSIEEAAEILDALSPEWEKKVDVAKLSMVSNTDCILGQLFYSYMAGLEELFGRKRALATPISDEIFGSNASTLVWTHQVLRRLHKEEPEQPKNPEPLPLLKVTEVKTRYIDIPAMRLSSDERAKIKILIDELNNFIKE